MRNHFTKTPSIILASRSPRRVELLKQIGIHAIPHPADIDETQLNGESPVTYVLRLAEEKAAACLHQISAPQSNDPILAADTTVELNGQVLGKPENDNEARNMLASLAGTVHLVHTAVALAYQNKIEVVLSTSSVEMMPLSAQQIEHYIASGEHRDKAGSYGIQGLAGTWIKRIEGSYSGVMGLPIFETAALLRQHQIIQI
ncbi:MAG: Maf family protein [Methylotenera sp.]